jgi:O-antigen/teichoic acid export membrane protein
VPDSASPDSSNEPREPIYVDVSGEEEPVRDPSNELAEEDGFNVRRGLKNAGWLVSGNYISFALSFLTVIVVARPLGPKGYGLVSAVLAFVGMFSWAALSGFDRLVVRTAVGDEAKLQELVSTTLGLKLIVGLCALVAALVGAWVVPGLSPTERVGITVAAAIIAINPLIGTLNTACQVHEQMQWIPIVGLCRQLVYIAGAALLILAFGAKPLPVIIAFVFAYFVALLMYRQVAARWIRTQVNFRFKELGWTFIKAGLLFTFIGFFSFLYTKVDVLMIRAYGDLTEVGLYAAALTLFSRVNSTMELFSVAFFPQIVRQAKKGVLVLSDMRGGVLALAALGMAAAVVGSLVAPWVIPFVLGAGFKGSVLPFQLLLVALAVGMPFYPLSLLYQARGMEATLAKVIPVRAVLNVALDAYVLSRGWGIAGVAAGTLVTSIIYYTVLTIVAGRHGLLRRTAVAEGGGA